MRSVIAEGAVVADRILFEDGKRGRIHTDAEGIYDGLDLVRRDGAEGAGGVVEGDDALLEVLGRDSTVDAGRTSVAAAFIVDEEKRLVARHWSAHRGAKEIDQQRGALNADAIVEEAVGRCLGAAAVFVECNMVV